MSERLTLSELNSLQGNCLQKVQQDELYKVRNDAKLRAVTSVSSYDEFKNVVDAAHLKPLDKMDKQNAKTKNRLWNNVVSSSE